MKTSLFFLGTFFIISLLGCSNNDNGPENPSTPVDRSANLRTTGASANDILSNSSFTRLQIEIAYVQGFRPTAVAINNFTAYLRALTFKEDIELLYRELPSPGEETLTLAEVVDLETENRTAYNVGETLAIYIYFADSPSDTDDEEEGLVTLGAVYRNTSMIIYENTIRDLAARSPFILESNVETATINHEFGHLLGLVNLGTPMVMPHEEIVDSEGNKHCNVEGCLMRAELQFGAGLTGKIPVKEVSDEPKFACTLSSATVLKMLSSETAAGGTFNTGGLDPLCLQDLEANGGRDTSE
ncbi:MAG: hypothetical protein AAGA86_00190 [Bacteroidota bacterium]